MGSIGPYEFFRIDQFIMKNNLENQCVKFFPHIEEETLISISVRFFPPEESYFTTEIEKKIFDKIKVLSNSRIFMEKNGLLKYGIMELRVSYVQRHCDVDDLIQALEFIASDMLDVIEH